MNFVYFLLESTLTILPFVILYFLEKSPAKKFKNWGIYVLSFFLFHNLLFGLGFSIKGDYFDYVIFALEYSFILASLVMVKRLIKNTWATILNAFVIVVWALGFVIALPGLLLFIV